MFTQIEADFDGGALLLLLAVAVGILWALRLVLRQNRQDLKTLEAELAQEKAADSTDDVDTPGQK